MHDAGLGGVFEHWRRENWLTHHLLADRIWTLLTDTTTKDDDLLLEDDDDFDPETQKKRRSKASAKVAPGAETARKETHTLDEHYDHLLSASYELSFSQPGPPGAEGPSSSQVEVPFENFFPFSDGLDLADGLGDDLARELGWGVSPAKSVQSNRFAVFFYAPTSIWFFPH
jgi:meiotic recombination protein REC8, fungi type